jgi:glycosyltransferase involved in cell wall biosynthesis
LPQEIVPLKPVRVLVVGQTPPPVHGQAAMIQLLVEGNYRKISVCHVRMNFSQDADAAGKFRLRKIWELVSVVACIYWAKIRHWPDVLYYPPSGPRMLPVVRDIFILGSTRWLFDKTVFHFHASGISEYSQTLSPVLRKLFQLSFAAPDLTIRISEKAPPEGAALRTRREVIIPNGIPDSAGKLIERHVERDSPLKVLFVAVLCEDKGVLVAIQSVLELLRSGFDVELTCLGQWASTEFEQRAMAAIDPQFQSRFRFPGVTVGDEKWSCYSRADIFLFPTYYHSETFPVVLLEAMCFGLPIVTTNWRAIPDVVEEGKCALVCEPKNVASCRMALQELIEDPSMRAKMGRRSRERFLTYFTVEAHRDAIELALASVKG